MKTLFYIIMLVTFTSSNQLRIDLGTNSQSENWQIVNDGVMGGLSRGQIKYEEDYIRFFGKLSLENNGGFS